MAKNPKNQSKNNPQPENSVDDIQTEVTETEKTETEVTTPENTPENPEVTEQPTETETTPNEDTDNGTNGDVVTDNTNTSNVVEEVPNNTKPEVNVSATENALRGIENQLKTYGELMGKNCHYSRTEGPKNQLIIISIFEDIFVNTVDYDLMRAKIVYLFKYFKDLSKTDNNFLYGYLPFRGLDDVKLPGVRRENYSRLLNMVQRLALAPDPKKALTYLSLDFTFEHHPRAATLENAKTIINELYG